MRKFLYAFCYISAAISLTSTFLKLLRWQIGLSHTDNEFSKSTNCLTVVSSASSAYVGEDRPFELPLKLKAVEMEFGPSVHYTTNGSLDEWESITPGSGGFVRLGPTNRAFEVAMFHQFDCLTVLRRGIQNANDYIANYAHVQFCFFHLRQLFLCKADDTLEPCGNDTLESCQDTFVRQCRDWSEVYSFLDENHVAFRDFRTKNMLN